MTFSLNAVAHGMVRFLYKRDPEAFLTYYGLLREGKPAEEALEAAFELDYEAFGELWQAEALDVLNKP